jgi:hypothetical protein
MEVDHTAHNQHGHQTDVSALVAQATRKLKPYHNIVEPSPDTLSAREREEREKRTVAFDRDALVRLADETALLKELLRECKRHSDTGRLDEYQALIAAHAAVDTYIQRWLPDVTITHRDDVDWSIALPPSAELDVLIQVAVLLLLDVEQAI